MAGGFLGKGGKGIVWEERWLVGVGVPEMEEAPTHCETRLLPPAVASVYTAFSRDTAWPELGRHMP